MKKAFPSCVLTAFWLMAAQPALAGGDPMDWLTRMSTAMSQMSYQGTFVYVLGDEIETMRITHVSDQDGVRERLVSLTGPQREVLKSPDGVRWVLGDRESVLMDGAFKRSFFPRLPLEEEARAGQSYSFRFGKTGRIAGHKALNVKIMPRDHYRYGYSLWLEKNSGLLLKWELVDNRREPLAKLMFTELRLGSAVDESELKTSRNLEAFETIESGLPSGGSSAVPEPHWRPTRLPPGFELSTNRCSLGAGENGEYEHLIYSDGLAAISVYVESPVRAIGRSELIQKHGTTHAYSKARDDVLVTVVGNVPAVTVEMIGRSVERFAP